MRRRFRLLLFLLIVFSFLLGFPKHTLDLEVISVAKAIGPAGGALAAIKVLLLITVHLALMSLLFIDQDELSYKRNLVVFPAAFLVVHTFNAFYIYSAEPRILLTALPFCVTYLLCLFQYTRLDKTERTNPGGQMRKTRS